MIFPPPLSNFASGFQKPYICMCFWWGGLPRSYAIFWVLLRLLNCVLAHVVPWMSYMVLCWIKTAPCGHLSITLALLQVPWHPAARWCRYLIPVKGLLNFSQYFYVPYLLETLEVSVDFPASFWSVLNTTKLPYHQAQLPRSPIFVFVTQPFPQWA